MDHGYDTGTTIKTPHTPAPWHTSARPSGFVYGPKGEQVADCQSMLPIDEAKANARLIAAAPELLDAINEAEKYLSGWFMVEDTDLVGRALDTLRAAIKKARGA